MNNFELLKIRTLNSTQHFAFEELCCQLASLEPKKAGDSFYRKGPGADAGVECYICHADGSETGWQAKFLKDFDSKKPSQLTESFQQAIKKHPNLTRYIVCLPIDLKDGRTGKNKTEGQRWRDWKSTRLAEMEAGRNVDIVLWQAGDIRERLHRNDPFYAGRIRFFFDEIHFSAAWFCQQVSSACTILGSRYTPQYHVSLPIRQAFLGLSRDAWLEEQRENWIMPLIKKFKGAQSRIREADIPEIDYTNLCNNAEQLIASLSGAFPLTKSYPVTNWLNQIGQLQANIRNCMTQFWNSAAVEKDETQKSNRQVALNSLYEFEQTLDDIQGKLHSNAWQLANEQAVLVYGEAGSGKSHLLADVAADAVKKGYPAIFLITSQFFLQDPRTQILERLDLRHIDFSTFLGALDAAGQAAGVRALLIIDALNERHGIELWREYLASLITEVKRYPHLALIVSCRSTYLDFVIPTDSPLHNSLTRIEHQGFADGGGYAARAYLTKRKIIRPSVPNLLPEFNNPLFLKTLCDSLDKQGLNAFPPGIQGLTQYFDFYLQALSKNIEDRMGLDKRQNIIGRALTKFTEQLLERQFSYLPLPETIVCFDEVFPSMGQQNRSLLSELEHEGIVTVEPVYIDNDQPEEQVRFTFERFSDFQIAGHLLNQHMAGGKSFEPLEADTPLHDFLARKDIYRIAGIIEALAVLLPETTEFELPEILSPENELDDWIYERAFLKSLLLRRQDRFTDKTRKWVISLSTDHHTNYWLTTLVAISTEPENCFNAHYLHEKLAPLAMPERDAKWSIEVLATSDYDDDSPLDVLISWALESGFNDIEPKRAELAAILLTWLFSVSNRKVRDKATKALSALLAPRLPLAISLMERFKSIDDLYILERLLAASYGAAMQAQTREKLGELAQYVYQWLFADGKPPSHLLLRDYARGIIEYALHCGLLPKDVAIEKARPPYYSDWPIEFVAEANLEKYGDAYRDHILQSVTGWLGDFGNKIIEAAINNWSSSSLKLEKGLTPQQNFVMFTSMLTNSNVSGQLAAFTKLHTFCLDSRKSEVQEKDDTEIDNNINFLISYKTSESIDEDRQRKEQNEEKFYALEKEFMALLDNTKKFHYWISARHGLMELMNHYTSEISETFDAQLAKYWVTKRAHDFGWSHNLFGEFDERIGTGRGRSNKHIERIGKKYQWLAFYELLSHMADNLIYVSGYSDDPNVYDGPWQISERNIDPSLLISKTQDDGWTKHPATWWSPQAPKLRLLNRQEQRLWLHNDSDQLNSASLLDIVDPKTEQCWLAIKGFKHYSTPYDIGSHINSWCRIWCVVIKKQHKNQFINAVSKHTLIDPRALPEIGEFYYAFIGEYPWHPSYKLANDWVKVERDYGFRYKVLPTTAEYNAEKAVYDYSLEGNINVFLPAPWLIEKLGLRLIDGRTIEYADATGRTLFKDPSVHEEGPSTALIDRTTFLDLLSKENLAPVWIIAGEKGAYGEQHDDFIGRRVHSFVYALNDENKIVCVEQMVNIEEH